MTMITTKCMITASKSLKSLMIRFPRCPESVSEKPNKMAKTMICNMWPSLIALKGLLGIMLTNTLANEVCSGSLMGQELNPEFHISQENSLPSELEEIITISSQRIDHLIWMIKRLNLNLDDITSNPGSSSLCLLL